MVAVLAIVICCAVPVAVYGLVMLSGQIRLHVGSGSQFVRQRWRQGRRGPRDLESGR